VLDVAYKSGFKTRKKPSFNGQRIGRGAAWGTLASAGFMNTGGRRAVVKVRIAKLRAGNLAARPRLSPLFTGLATGWFRIQLSIRRFFVRM
jgi:hypothetical protein